MRRYVCWTIIGVAALLVLKMGQIQADETKTYSLGTKLLFREYNVPVTIVPLGARESGLSPSFDWGPLAQNPFGRDITGPARDQGAAAVAGLLAQWPVWKPGLTPSMAFLGSTSLKKSW